jgi:hypothetical protein
MPELPPSTTTQGLARQHLAVDCRDLVGKRFDTGAVYREVGVEQVCEPDALSLGRDPEYLTITIKAECAAGLHQL